MIAGQSKLVEHARIAIIEGNERLVLLDRAIAAAKADVHVTQHFDGAQRRRVELGGAAEIAQSGFELALRVVDRATLEVGDHRIGITRDGAAVGLDRLKSPLLRRGLVARPDEAFELALVGQCGLGEGPGPGGDGNKRDGEGGSAHEGKW